MTLHDATPARTTASLRPLAVIAGFGAVAALPWLFGTDGFAWLFVACGLGHAVMAYLLAYQRVMPGLSAGYTPLGQGLWGAGWLAMGAVSLIDLGELRVVHVALGLGGLGCIVVGGWLESKARREWPGP